MRFRPALSRSDDLGFRDLYDQYQAIGVNIVGVSFDSPERNATFKENEEFQYPLWSDVERELALYDGAAPSANALFADRITVLLDADGTWLLRYVPNALVGLYAHPAQVLEDCQRIFAP